MLFCAFMLIFGIFFAGYLTNIPAFFVIGTLFSFVSFLNMSEKNMKKRCFFAFFGFMLYAFGGLYSFSYSENLFKKAQSFASANKSFVLGTVTDDITVSKTSTTVVLKLKNGILVNLKCYTDENFLPGDIVCVYNPKTELLDKNNRKIAKYNRLMGKNTLVSVTCYNNQVVKRGVDKHYKIQRYFYNLRKSTFYSLVKYLDFQQSAFAYSVISSDKTYMSNETYSDFVNAGLIHLSSVSGFHFVFLCSVFTYLSILFSPYHRRRIFFVTVLSFVFMLYTGGGPSVFRAFLMFVGTQIGDLFYSRRFKSSTCLVFATIVLMLQNPMCVFNNSFLLSFGATYGIVFLNKDVTSFFGNLKMKQTFIINFCVNVFTLPIIFASFGRITIFSAISNLAVGEVAGIMMVLSFLLWGADIFLKPLCLVIAPVLKIIIKYIFFVVKFVSKIEVLKITVPFSAVCAVILSGMLVFLIKYMRNVTNKRILISFCTFFATFFVIFGMQCYDNNTYADFISNSDKSSVDIINKHRHIVVSNAEEFIYNKYNSSLRQNEVIDVFIFTDSETENTDKFYEALKDYKINNIVGFEKVVEKMKKDGIVKSNFYNFDDFSSENIGFLFRDNSVIYVEYSVENKKVLITDNYDYIKKNSKKLKDCTVLFSGTNKYIKEIKKLDFENDTELFCCDSTALMTLN